jgi:hypothetical protein
MTTLEIILITIIWVSYGVFNSWQHDWYFDPGYDEWFFILINIIFAPIALVIRIIRGVFVWKGEYKN